MYFKPKIFISSVLSLSEIRNKIMNHFNSIGAEILLYESNLTPSINRSSYRQDILDSDFVIFIIGEEYGSQTDMSISGTHEEYEIIKNSNIPMHLYLKNLSSSNIDQNLIDFKNEISNDNISYFYYKNNNQLIKRLKETTFQIAKEISLNNILNINISPKKIINKSAEIDYHKGLEIIRDFDDIIKFLNRFSIDTIDSTAIISYFEILNLLFEDLGWYFIDISIDKSFKKLIDLYKHYVFLSVNTMHSIGDSYTIKTRSNKEISFTRLTLSGPRKDYEELIERFNNFIEYITTFSNEI